MLEAFVRANRDAIIARSRASVAASSSPKPSDMELTHGIPVFLDQLCAALRRAESNETIDNEALRETAKRHGQDLLSSGVTVAQVVRDYGNVCRAITDLAVAEEAPIPPEEFRTFNLCLDDAVAEDVTEYSRRRESAIESRGTERIGVLAHELRNHLSSAAMSFELIRVGKVTPEAARGPSMPGA